MSAAVARTIITRPDVMWAIRRFPASVLAAALMTLSLAAEQFDWDLIPQSVRLRQDEVTFMLLLAFLSATAAAFATLRLRPWAGITAQAAGFLFGFGISYVTDASSNTVMLLCMSMVVLIGLGAGLTAGRGMTGACLTVLRLALNLALCLIALALTFIGGAIILLGINEFFGYSTGSAFHGLSIIACWFGVPVLWLSLARFCEDAAALPHPIRCRALP
jgi:hypothetical protein